MAHCAQTNLQLYNQLIQAGWAQDDLALIRDAYELAIQLFANRFRSNGKPFICHLVGTASILASEKAPPATVAAGLVHAAYAQGDFGDGGKGITPRRRQAVRATLDDATEALLHRYTGFSWRRALPKLPQQWHAMTPLDRQVVLMRLANELEEHLDAGARYTSKPDPFSAAPLRDSVIALARAAGHASLADKLSLTFNAADEADIPPWLRAERRHSFSARPAAQGENLLDVGTGAPAARTLMGSIKALPRRLSRAVVTRLRRRTP